MPLNRDSELGRHKPNGINIVYKEGTLREAVFSQDVYPHKELQELDSTKMNHGEGPKRKP